MSTINILGIDIGKSTFHIFGHDLFGREIFRAPFITSIIFQRFQGLKSSHNKLNKQFYFSRNVFTFLI